MCNIFFFSHYFVTFFAHLRIMSYRGQRFADFQPSFLFRSAVAMGKSGKFDCGEPGNDEVPFDLSLTVEYRSCNLVILGDVTLRNILSDCASAHLLPFQSTANSLTCDKSCCSLRRHCFLSLRSLLFVFCFDG